MRRLTLVCLFFALLFFAARSETPAVRELAPGVLFWQGDHVRLVLAQWDVRTVVPGHGSLGTTETLRAQRAYLADMLQRVRSGLQGGKTADELVQQVDLSKHGSFGASAEHNGGSIRAIYRKLAAVK